MHKKAFLLFTKLLLTSNAYSQHVFSVEGTQTFMDNKAFQAIGLRCSNSLYSDEVTDDLIDHLDIYQDYGINTISVFLWDQDLVTSKATMKTQP